MQAGSSAPISQVFCEEKLPMNDGSYARIAVTPTLRMLSSTIASSQQNSTNYIKLYLPVLEKSATHYYSQGLTLTGDGITKITRSGVDQIRINVSFLNASQGFDSSFFNFKSNSVTLNSTTSPSLPANSVVEIYIGKVAVGIGQG